MIYQLIAIFLLAQQAPAVLSAQDCYKNVDCQPNAFCQTYDHYQYPAMWPPCPHFGVCACNPGTVLYASNNTCIPMVNLFLGDKCSNQIWEVIQPAMRCNGGKVVCNTPAYTEPLCIPRLLPTPVIPVITAVPVSLCQTVGYLATCDSAKKKFCCLPGLTCTLRGTNATYWQCMCPKGQTFDSMIGLCRPRVYGDDCLTNEDCDTKLIANNGFECRLGRCRCQSGYDPVDNLYWNETSKATYTRRICISNKSISWVPTGQACTMDPHLFADAATTRVCHPRAFCRLCYNARKSYKVGQATPVTGTCREFTCSSVWDCNTGICNKWEMQVDPPCDRGMCDCDWAQGMYMNLFSRCGTYEKLPLGHRCIVPDLTTQLHPWYPNNEDWDDDKTCATLDKGLGGFAGYNYGVVKCKSPLYEDSDGFCIRNDFYWNLMASNEGYNASCDDTDNRIPLKRCNSEAGLVCLNKKCQCPSSATCSATYAGCGAVAASSSAFWDPIQYKCRTRGFSDQCSSNSECCGGTCINGACGCPAGLAMLQFSAGINIQNGDNRPKVDIKIQNYCFKNISVVGKGSQCHLDPVAWNCASRQLYGSRKDLLPPLVCAPGLVCLRCPADFSPDDETFGVCRAVQQIPQTHPVPAAQQSPYGGYV